VTAAGPRPGAGPEPSVLICEDSPTYAGALRRMLEHDGDISVAAVYGTAEEALRRLDRVRLDLITMDIELPGMDGLVAVEEIMSSRPMPVLVLSSHVGSATRKAAAALAAGALDALAKDDLDLEHPGGSAGAAFRDRVRLLSRARVVRHPRARLRSGPVAEGQERPASAVGICASTGGPQVIARLLASLPVDYQVPVLVVQHIAPGFAESVAHWLGESARVPVRVAADGTPAGPGAWIAPQGAHLTISGSGRLSLDRRTVTGIHRPSGDVLFESIASAAGPAGVAVVLSGLGSDGARGAASVQDRGGLAMTVDEQSAAVYGMPRAAIERGVDLVLPIAEVAARLGALSYQPLPGAAR
jgi:two-component system chemotaxis response regulator CheB